jgi:hypothetical protein
MPAAQMTAISARIVDDDSFQSFASIAKVREEYEGIKCMKPFHYFCNSAAHVR